MYELKDTIVELDLIDPAKFVEPFVEQETEFVEQKTVKRKSKPKRKRRLDGMDYVLRAKRAQKAKAAVSVKRENLENTKTVSSLVETTENLNRRSILANSQQDPQSLQKNKRKVTFADEIETEIPVEVVEYFDSSSENGSNEFDLTPENGSNEFESTPENESDEFDNISELSDVSYAVSPVHDGSFQDACSMETMKAEEKLDAMTKAIGKQSNSVENYVVKELSTNFVVVNKADSTESPATYFSQSESGAVSEFPTHSFLTDSFQQEFVESNQQEVIESINGTEEDSLWMNSIGISYV